ncbi:sulfatase-like hydrolase/transferase [Streptomyces sp. NBC_00090]|uniref:hypothetical protein n=1 Tax=Streptomyces sp. NBC_00090 TaxID=2903619 RepID=UPI00324D1E4B
MAVSDNGGSGEGGPDGTFNEWRFFNGLPTSTELSLEHLDELGSPVSCNHYPTGWAWAFDTPFPYWKGWAGYEGGVADMCLVAWPAKIQPQREVRQQYVHAVDVVPTLYELLDIEPPAELRGYPQSPIEGESFAASLTDPTVPGKQTQFHAMLGQRSIYHDGWLACTVHPPHPPLSGWGNFSHDRRELYNLTEDRAQSTDVAVQEPERLETLKSLWYYYAGRYNGLPLDDRTALEQGGTSRPGAFCRAVCWASDCCRASGRAGCLPGLFAGADDVGARTRRRDPRPHRRRPGKDRHLRSPGPGARTAWTECGERPERRHGAAVLRPVSGSHPRHRRMRLWFRPAPQPDRQRE